MAHKADAARVLIRGRAIPLPGDDIDTDRIIPARFLKTISFDKLAEHVFHDERFDEEGREKEHPFNDPRFRGARILVVGRNFGCGSSREHAPQAIVRWGIGAVIGESFGEIFSGNSTAIGMPAVRAARPDVERLMAIVQGDPGTEIEIDLGQKTVRAESLETGDLAMRFEMPEGDRRLLLSGEWDTTGLLLKNLDAIKETEARIPYLRGFRSGFEAG